MTRETPARFRKLSQTSSPPVTNRPRGLELPGARRWVTATPSPEVLKITEDAAKVFEEIGCRVTPVEKVFDADPLPMFMAEFFAGAGSKLKPVMEQSRDRLDPAVALMVDKALAQEAEAYFETVFQRYKLREMIAEFFVDYDLLLTSTLPVPAFETGLNVPPGYSDENAFTWIFYTYPFNLTGLPAASIPAGFTDDGLPVGLQIVDRHLMETDILSAASAFEEARPRADKKPPLTRLGKRADLGVTSPPTRRLFKKFLDVFGPPSQVFHDLRDHGCCLGGFGGERFHLSRNHGKSLAGIARPGGFNGGVEGKQVGLPGDPVDLFRDIADPADIIHKGGYFVPDILEILVCCV